MSREYNSRVSSKNSEQLLKNLKNTRGDYFFAAPCLWCVCCCVQDALRSVTRVAIKEARSREITDQMAHSDRLKVLFYARLMAALVYHGLSCPTTDVMFSCCCMCFVPVKHCMSASCSSFV